MNEFNPHSFHLAKFRVCITHTYVHRYTHICADNHNDTTTFIHMHERILQLTVHEINATQHHTPSWYPGETDLVEKTPTRFPSSRGGLISA